MLRTIFIIYNLFVVTMMGLAQTVNEQIVAFTDKDCYLAGERLCVRVDATIDDLPSPSRVAYIEISDTKKMHTQCMVALTDGQGWGEIALPETMHSGCYQLTAYTRAMQSNGAEAFFRTIIGVINAEKLLRNDNIEFMPYDSSKQREGKAISLLQKASFEVGETVSVKLPDAIENGASVSVYRAGISADMESGNSISRNLLHVVPQNVTNMASIPEIEGHIIQARTEGNVEAQIGQVQLSIIGKSPMLYDGKKQTDGSYLFFTSGVSGNMPVAVNSYDVNGQPVRMTLVSPYMSVLPKELPKLTVFCQEQELLQQATAARKQAAIDKYNLASPLSAQNSNFISHPDHIYDLDEYTQMSTINELLIEFVKGVSRSKSQGVSKLFTLDATGHYSKWPALVLLDGMPVHDIDEILTYDAHLVRYVHVYSDRFFFGETICQGVISFITRKGLLSNYKLKEGENLMSYSFPQDRPSFIDYAPTNNTHMWQPSVANAGVIFKAPSSPGSYILRIQGRKKDGSIYCREEIFDVTN